MRFIHLVFVSVCLFSASVMASQPMLLGELTQGSLIRGKTSPGTELFLNGKNVLVSKNGEFAFGFGRDAALRQTLSWRGENDTDLQNMTLSLAKRQYNIDKIEGVEQKYVSPPEAVLARIRQDNKAVANARAYNTDALDFLADFILPAQGRISGVYGSQRIFNGQAKRPHYGLDVANKTGTPIIAPAGGTIRMAHKDLYYSGGTIILDHGFGVSSTFIHMSKLHVEEGQRVEQGELIGEIGATGRVTGPHLDWRINWFKERLDPALLVDLPKAK
ncbi:M23 family metallopeptidase [Glaciecola sp. 2405UD65-10]|uniref:M23 family metallopeptidase n=1 Tax=Glaciecola sp. 2405UD65-10 TaxID=3397244 RepID=UPI003B58D5D2